MLREIEGKDIERIVIRCHNQTLVSRYLKMSKRKFGSQPRILLGCVWANEEICRYGKEVASVRIRRDREVRDMHLDRPEP